MWICMISYLVSDWAIKSLPYDESWTDAKGQFHKVHVEESELNSYYSISKDKYKMTYSVQCVKNQSSKSH